MHNQREHILSLAGTTNAFVPGTRAYRLAIIACSLVEADARHWI
ncbi:hypothetical protein OEV75_14565 [Caldibacillus kokeshiiformis]|nr:hypothetical protein [Pallidibacillus thermolactis subsp. kokeshiiformis]